MLSTSGRGSGRILTGRRQPLGVDEIYDRMETLTFPLLETAWLRAHRSPIRVIGVAGNSNRLFYHRLTSRGHFFVRFFPPAVGRRALSRYSAGCFLTIEEREMLRKCPFSFCGKLGDLKESKSLIDLKARSSHTSGTLRFVRSLLGLDTSLVSGEETRNDGKTVCVSLRSFCDKATLF
jgi:hypothetical protein